MALTRTESQILWATAASITLSDNNAATSDAIVFDATDIQAAVQVSADNAGTPAAGDYIDVWVAYTSGDVLGDASDDYDTTEHAEFLGRLNTYATDTPGEDPARRTYDISAAPKGIKLIVKGNQTATRNAVIRARLNTQRSSS